MGGGGGGGVGRSGEDVGKMPRPGYLHSELKFCMRANFLGHNILAPVPFS